MARINTKNMKPMDNAPVANKGRRRKSPNATPEQAGNSLVVPLFMFSFLLPLVFYVGVLRLSPYRVVLVVLFFPLFFNWLSGGMGKIRTPDVLMLLFVLWGILAMLVNNGLEKSIEPSGILLIETFGSYLIARRYIRNAANFIAMIRALLWLILCLLPFAVYETITGTAIILEVLSKVINTHSQVYMDPRMGLHRVHVVFEHPILYGVFCASAFGLAYYAIGYKQSIIRKLRWLIVVVVSTLFSVSTGAFVAIIIQQFLISWGYILRKIPNRWRILGQLIAFLYVLVDLISNRSPFHVFVTYLTFSVDSAYGRILIWNFGTDEVARHPIFGIGLNDWVRPDWMSSSMDNFWLAIAVFYGLPGFLLFVTAILLIMRGVGRAKFDNDQSNACRKAILVSLGGLFIAGCTVYYWNAIYCWYVFLVGSGMWMFEYEKNQNAETSTDIDNQLQRKNTKMS